jgi:hypothetical protein
MVFFRKKKKEEDIKEIKNAVEDKITEPMPQEMDKQKLEETFPEKPKKDFSIEVERPKKVEEGPKKPESAPLFVKIDRYKIVLDLIAGVKNTINTLKNVIETQKRLEELNNENRNLLEAAINTIDKQVLSLDSEFLRPKGYQEEIQPIQDTEDLEGVVGDLKSQIEGLKAELKSIS